MTRILALSILLVMSVSLAAQEKTKDYVVTIETQFGNIRLVLFDDTPKHKENMLGLIANKYYDGLAFHRVIDGFMVQGGDATTREEKKSGDDALSKETIPAEIVNKYKHNKGMLAAARLGDAVNPEKRSSRTQFYIVENEKGTPHLDGAYTVFGKVITGMDVVEKIASVKTGQGDKPLEAVRMKVTAKKMSVAKIKKCYGYHFYD